MPLWEQNISMMYMCLYIHTYDYIIYDYTYDYIYIYDYIQQNIVLEKLRNEDEFVAAERNDKIVSTIETESNVISKMFPNESSSILFKNECASLLTGKWYSTLTAYSPSSRGMTSLPFTPAFLCGSLGCGQLLLSFSVCVWYDFQARSDES
jgi:hypothetical protein